jgi:signal peptidase II
MKILKLLLIILLNVFILQTIALNIYLHESQYILNKAIIIGTFGNNTMAIFISLLIIITFFIYYIKYLYILSLPIIDLAFVIIISGGISNLFERIIYEGVIDYIRIYSFPVFNIADIYISIGIMILLYSYINIDNYVHKSQS